MNRMKQRNPNLALAISLIAILSVMNSLLAFIFQDESRKVIIMVTEFLTIFFVLSFLYRFSVAGSKARYLVREYGWLDLLACLPFFQISWLFRGPRAYLTLRHLTYTKIREDVRREGAEFTLFIAMFIIIAIIEASSLSILFFEGQVAHANIVTAQDALWWVYVTIATVGYGDLYPVTSGGRFIGIVLMTAGVGIFATVAGYFAHRLLYKRTGSGLDGRSAPSDGDRSRALERKLADIEGRQKDILGRLERIEELLRSRDLGNRDGGDRGGRPRR